MDSKSIKAKKTFQDVKNFPRDLVIVGKFLSSQTEHREWDKDGVHKSMDLLAFYVQSPSGDIYVCRSYNPSYQFEDFVAGDDIVIPVSEYRIDNMVKSVVVRV